MAAFFASENAKSRDCVQTDEAYLDYQARLLVENVRLLSISPDEFRKRVRIEGEDCLQNALRKGRGVILLFSHVGNWLLAPCMLSLLGHRVAGIAYEIPIRSVEQHMKRIWARYSITTSHVGRESVRAAKRALDRQSILLMAFDASVRPSRSQWMPFGEGALLADPGPARLTSLLNVPTLRVRVQPEAAMKNLVTIEPVPPHDTDMMTSWLNTLHQEVSRNPHLWWPWSVVKLADRSLVPREAGVVLEQASIPS
jgi:KDO2-lipid IV(A) lauroyltransferase